MTTRTNLDRCSNLSCPNKPDEGRFEMVVIEVDRRPGFDRPISLFLCTPCSNSMDEATK